MRMRALCAALAVLCLAAPASAAASTHPFLGTLASGTPGGSGFPQPPPLRFDDACGVAVDTAGNRYVSDYHHGFVALFDPGNEFVSKIPSQASENSACGLAIDSTGRLYANDLHQTVVRLRPSPATIDPERSTGLAVGPDDRIYVAHRDRVSVYPPGGGPLEATIGLGALTDAYGLAVSAAGRVYVGDAATNTIKAFDPATDPVNPVQTIDGSGVPEGHFTDLTDTDLAISPTSGDLLVIDDLQPGFEHPLAAVDEFTAAGAYVGQISHWVNLEGSPPKPVNYALRHAGPSGLAVDSTGRIYVTSGNEEGSVLYGFAASASLTSARAQVSLDGTGAGTVASQLNAISNTAFTGIDCGQLCASEYEAGEAVTFKATPAPHSTFAGWSVPGQPTCTTSPSCRFQLFGATQLTATFIAIPQRILSVSKAGAGAGTVTSSPAGLDCGAACTQSFDQGSKVTLTAEAAPGSEFAGWSGACSGAAETCKVTLGADVGVAAEFRPISHLSATPSAERSATLAISVVGSGFGIVASEPAGIQCGTPCSGSYSPGAKITLTATPGHESHFAGWSGCDAVAANRCTVTLAASRTVSANFAEGGLLELGAFKQKGAGGVLAVKVAGVGSISASAKQLAPATVKAKHDGTVSLPLALSRAGRRALAHSKSGALAVKATVTFAPSGGEAPVTMTKTVTFKKGSKK